MKRTLDVVFDEISDFSNAYGTFYSVSGLFEDESLLQANKKTREDAQELRALLLQLVGIECDYYTEDKGLSKNGRQKWKLQAILDAEGGSIYGKPPQNVGLGPERAHSPSGGDRVGNVVTPVQEGSPGSRAALRGVAPRDPHSDKDAEIRAAVAAKAAAIFVQGQGWQDFEAAFYNISDLLSKTSAAVESSVETPSPSTPPAAGTSSEEGTGTRGDALSPSSGTKVLDWDKRGTFQDDWVAKGLIEPPGDE